MPTFAAATVRLLSCWSYPSRVWVGYLLLAIWLCGCWNGWSLARAAQAASDPTETKVWEYAPYQVRIWYAVHPDVNLPEAARSHWLGQLELDLQRAYQATWRLQIDAIPDVLYWEAVRHLEYMTLEDLQRHEYSLVVSTTHADTQSIKSLTAAAELPTIAISEVSQRLLQHQAERDPPDPDSPTGRVLNKLNATRESDLTIARSVADGSLAAALVPRSLTTNAESLRQLPTLLSWQTDVIVNRCDKIFFLVVQPGDQGYQVQVRELDSAMRHWGPTITFTSDNWWQAARISALAVQSAFAPVARVEQAEDNVAVLRHRAGGLITDDENAVHPARIRVGDVLQPIIRRDDRNGNATLLQTLDFTFAAVTQSDGIHMRANVYTYSGGPGLRGRQNPRTTRWLLRVRPQATSSELQFVARGQPQKQLSGCFVFGQDPLSGQLSQLGRSDWRGRMNVPSPDSPVRILPHELHEQRMTTLRKLRDDAIQEAHELHQQSVQHAKAAGLEPPPFAPPNLTNIDVPIDSSALIQLNTPIVQVYVKNGNQVVARLPIVPGLKAVEHVELPDDALRVQAEAIVGGFQGQILDLVGQRNLLAARVKLDVQNGQLERASENLNRLRDLGDFNQMNDQLSRIQRDILERSGDSLSGTVRAPIDRMFKATRDMLQKFLQDDLVAQTAQLIQSAPVSQQPEN